MGALIAALCKNNRAGRLLGASHRLANRGQIVARLDQVGSDEIIALSLKESNEIRDIGHCGLTPCRRRCGTSASLDIRSPYHVGTHSRMPSNAPRKTPPRELATILDFVRYAASRFTEAKLAFCQGTRDAVEDAMFLVCEALHLPKDQAEAFLAARLTAPERRHMFDLIEKRVRTRTPAAYLVKRAYLQDHAFYVD